MNPMFIACCFLTIAMAVAFITTVIAIRYMRDEEYRDILCGSLIFWGVLFVSSTLVSAGEWKSKEEQYQYCMHKVNNVKYCTDKYLTKE